MTNAPLAPALGVAALLSACALPHDMAPVPPCGNGAASRIAWWGPVDPSERAAHEIRCRTVGDPVLVSTPAEGFAPPVPGDSVAVFNWNVAVGSADLLSFLQDEVGLSCAGPESRPGPRFRHVVLVLQEAHRRSDELPPLDDPRLAGRPSHPSPPPEHHRDVVETAARCGLAAAYLPSGRDGPDRPGLPRMDKGNAILSSLPLQALAAVETPYETERKVVLAADVDLPGARALRVVAAHLDVTTSFHRVLLSGNQGRLRQARGILAALDSLEQGEGRLVPTLVGGDFNSWSNYESALRLFRTALPDSPWRDGRSTRGAFPADHIFFREGATAHHGVSLVADSYRRLDDQYGSDHAPLFVWLSLEGPAEPR